MKNLLWPASRIHEALHGLVTQARLGAQDAVGSGALPAPPPAVLNDADAFSDWLTAAAHLLGAEAQPAESLYPDLDRDLARMGPALVRVPIDGEAAYLAILPGRNLHVLGPDRQHHRVSPKAIRALLCGDREGPIQDELRLVLKRAEIPNSRQARAGDAMLRQRLSGSRIGGIWLLRPAPSMSFWQQLRHAGQNKQIAALAAAHTIQYGLWILAWWVAGSNVLDQRTDRSWMWLWTLLLLTLIPFRVLITWLQGIVALSAGAKLKQRLFYGALKLDPDSIRHQGAGQLLGRVLESEAVESLALSGAFLAWVALIELVACLFILSWGAGGWLQSGLLGAWMVIGALIVRRYYERSRVWTDVRLRMTHDLVENMVGHRTRLAQLPPDRWHDGEDEALASYLGSSKKMDDSVAALMAMIPRGWLVLALAGLAPAFVSGDASTARIAIAVGGILLAFRALRRCATGAWQLAEAAVAWERVSVLFHAAAKTEAAGSVETAPADRPELIEAREVSFRYSATTPEVLRGCSLRITPGERLVLEGASGGGKSTLVSLLAGVREPSSGEVLVGGRSRDATGDYVWRKHIATAPQFHENHVLAETFTFNLLMGRHKMPAPQDIPHAEAVCRELGLGELIERMPAGLLQMVGETGWQLSHGERSRLYIARALLHDAGLVILDESFAALDPLNLELALECVLKRARSLLVISHR
ncbi:MAG TPA: ABC transporter ATP-binding protein [Bryobacteraceae bacterium]|nr:ABC transporter ATP-binding protein [Bryobacteraceae bacterium]